MEAVEEVEAVEAVEAAIRFGEERRRQRKDRRSEFVSKLKSLT